MNLKVRSPGERDSPSVPSEIQDNSITAYMIVIKYELSLGSQTWKQLDG